MTATTTALYQAAMKADDGIARCVLPDGSELFCCIDRVAGRSIVRKHLRTEWRHKAATEQYSKRISIAQAGKLTSRG